MAMPLGLLLPLWPCLSNPGGSEPSSRVRGSSRGVEACLCWVEAVQPHPWFRKRIQATVGVAAAQKGGEGAGRGLLLRAGRSEGTGSQSQAVCV